MDERIERYAEFCVRVGANVQPGQEVFVQALVEHAPLARALTRQAYRAGAAYVHVLYGDAHVRRAMIELGSDEALTYSPGWLKAFAESVAGNALVATTGDPEPELMADLDGGRVGRARMKAVTEILLRLLSENSVNSCIVGAPTEGWARQVLGEPDLERLWEKVEFCLRLDEPDPVVAWREHIARLDARAEMLTALRADALRYRGPGTDLTVGLLPSARWESGASETTSGIRYVANDPSSPSLRPDRA
ncbi:MAG TPA: aminopeptidase [Gaiellaceae bacterium]|nr:aminopeptidase [Gaiellaceae bacterium]